MREEVRGLGGKGTFAPALGASQESFQVIAISTYVCAGLQIFRKQLISIQQTYNIHLLFECVVFGKELGI